MLAPCKKSYDKPRQHIKTRDVTLPTKVHPSSQSYGFSSSHVRMWELNCKESWVPILNCSVESPLDFKEIKLVNAKGNQSWIFIGRTDVETVAPILWPPDAKNWLIRKDHEARKDWMQEEKGMTEGEMVGWHHWHDGHKFKQAPGVGDGQGKPGML